MSDVQDTPSIVDREITGIRPGRRLIYRDLTAREKRDVLFEQGIRATAYANHPGQRLPDVRAGLLEFSGAALTSIAHHLLRESLTRTSDELATPKRKLFHTYGATAKVVLTPAPDTPYTGLFGEEVAAWHGSPMPAP